MSIHIDILAELERRSVQKAAAELDQKFSVRTVQVGADVKAAEIKAVQEKLKREFSEIRAEIKVDVDKSAADRFRDMSRAIRETEQAGRSATQVLQNLGKTAFQAGRGLLTVAAPPAIIALFDVVKAGTAATQALWLLPAAATAAGAGMATLQLATSGFADTIKDIRDPKKFAEDIQGLSPAAQQAALSIQNLLPEFDKLKNATQDAFFANMGEQINRLATTYLPSIQNLTTGIATSFNTMLTGVANQLMTPETQANMQAMFENIGQAFRNLAPAAQPLIEAFTQIATIGSTFLPDLATKLTNAATSFANFIDNASQTGQLQQWIQEGITAVEGLISVSGELIKIFYRVFGPENQAQVDQLVSDLHGISEAIGIVMGDGQTWSDSWADEMSGMTGAAAGFRDMVLDIPEAFEVAFDSIIKVINKINHGINYMAQNAHDALERILPGKQEPYVPIPDIPLTEGTMGDWSGYQDPRGPFGHLGQPSLGGPMGGQRERRGAGPVPSPGAGIPGGPYGGPFAVPAPPPGGAGAKPSDRERLDAIRAGLDPSLYRVDPFAPVPGLPSPGALAGGPMPGGGYGAASGQEFFEGQQKIIEQAHQLEESRKDRLALERDNEATAEQINDAKWKEHQDEIALQKAQADLVEKTKGTAKSMKSGMDQLGVALDPDFGLSKGLSGLAENLVKFLGNIAAAPMEAKLQAISNADPIQGGYGLFGMLGARNISQGKSPILGRPLTPEQQQAYYSDTGAGTGTTGAGTTAAYGGMGGAAQSLIGFAQASSGGKYKWGASDLAAGLSDCSGAVSDLVELITKGQAGPERLFSTANAEQVLTQLGAVPGAVPGSLQIGWSSGHMRATLPNGVPFESGGGTGQGATYGGAAQGAEGMPNIMSLPVGGANAALGGGGGSYGGGSYGGLPIPLPVTIVGGGGVGGAAAIGPAPIGGARGAGSASAGGLNWDALAQKESSGQWDLNTGNGFYGGLQFQQSTWDAYKPAGAPARADLATKEQQIAAAQAAMGATGAQSQWPANYQQLYTPQSFGGATASGASGPMTWGGGMPSAGGGRAGGPGPTMPVGTGLGANPTQIGGIEPPSNPGGGGIGITSGGTLDTAISAAASGLDILAPGAGQAAQMGIKLANRAIQYGGQLAGIGVGGLMETFLPTGASELANNSWLTRIAGGLAGVSPQIPNVAGGKGQQGPLNPQQVQSFGGQTAAGQAPITVNYTNNGATEDRAGADIASNLRAANENQAIRGGR